MVRNKKPVDKTKEPFRTDHDNPIVIVFDAINTIIEEKGEFDIPPELGEQLPPWPVLLELLMDWAVSADSSDEHYHEAFLSVLHHAMHGLRIALRQGGSDEAQGWWEALQQALETALDKKHRLLSDSLADGFAELDFVLPEELISRVGEWRSSNIPVEFEEDVRDNEQTQAHLEPLEELLTDADLDAGIQLYEVLKPHLYYLPTEGLDAILPRLGAEAPIPLEALTYCLLHPRAAVRDHALAALEIPATLQNLNAVDRDRLIMLRNWLPAAQAKQLDTVIKTLWKRDLGPSPANKHTLQTWASVPDGTGATGLAILETIGKRFRVAGAILKENIGIVDCWQSPLFSKSEADRTLKLFRQHLPAIISVSGEFLQLLVPHYLAINCRSGQMPDPNLLQWLDQLGDALWQPSLLDFDAWLEARASDLEGLDPKPAFNRCARWYQRERDSLSWFEVDDDIDQAVATIIDNEKKPDPDVFEELLAPYRGKWYRRFVQLSIWSRCSNSSKKPQWQDFALLAIELNKGTPVADLPIMPMVVADTVGAAAERASMYGECLEEEEKEFRDQDDLDFEFPAYHTPDLFNIQATPAVSEKVGRNDPCLCGSGKKYKKCCGA